MQYKYTKNSNTPYSMVDRTGHLGLVEFMNLNQDMITEFCGSVGSDNATLREKNNAAWIYTRTKVKFCKELPFWNTKTKVVSYVSSMSSIRLELETDLYDEGDNLLVAAKTEMCAIDFAERKIRKIDTIEFPKDVELMPSNVSEPFVKNRIDFESADLVYSQRVYASDTDFTHHTNNVRYVKFIMNTFDEAFYDEKAITEFEIQFVKESIEGDVLDVYKRKVADNEYGFMINKGNETIIKASMKYKYNQ